MNNVTFILKKTDESIIKLSYKPFNFAHSELWYNGIKNYVNSGLSLTDTDRVYNFTDVTNIDDEITACNKTISDLNKLYPNSIPYIYKESLQEDVNFVHTFFVETDRSHLNQTNEELLLWTMLNQQLHGLEIIERSSGKGFNGAVFVSLPESTNFDLPDDSYEHFTVQSTFGYCYANYSHIGRHIHELFLANDTIAQDEHILPMNRISGDSNLWFGNNSSWLYSKYEMFKIKRWFLKNKIDKRLCMKWGDPKLSIGRLPVAKLITPITKKDLYGIVKLIDITIH